MKRNKKTGCPNCGNTKDVTVIIEESYDGTYDAEKRTTTVDYSCVDRTVTILCRECSEEMPPSGIENPK
jgi:hypothetical protein